MLLELLTWLVDWPSRCRSTASNHHMPLVMAVCRASPGAATRFKHLGEDATCHPQACVLLVVLRSGGVVSRRAWRRVDAAWPSLLRSIHFVASAGVLPRPNEPHSFRDTLKLVKFSTYSATCAATSFVVLLRARLAQLEESCRHAAAGIAGGFGRCGSRDTCAHIAEHLKGRTSARGREEQLHARGEASPW